MSKNFMLETSLSKLPVKISGLFAQAGRDSQA
jgi:hypothetical protein